MRVSLSCECERPTTGDRLGPGRGSVGCSGGATRGRLGPRFVTTAAGRVTIGRGPAATSPERPTRRRETVDSDEGVLNIQATKSTKRALVLLRPLRVLRVLRCYLFSLLRNSGLAR